MTSLSVGSEGNYVETISDRPKMHFLAHWVTVKYPKSSIHCKVNPDKGMDLEISLEINRLPEIVQEALRVGLDRLFWVILTLAENIARSRKPLP